MNTPMILALREL